MIKNPEIPEHIPEDGVALIEEVTGSLNEDRRVPFVDGRPLAPRIPHRPSDAHARTLQIAADRVVRRIDEAIALTESDQARTFLDESTERAGNTQLADDITGITRGVGAIARHLLLDGNEWFVNRISTPDEPLVKTNLGHMALFLGLRIANPDMPKIRTFIKPEGERPLTFDARFAEDQRLPLEVAAEHRQRNQDSLNRTAEEMIQVFDLDAEAKPQPRTLIRRRPVETGMTDIVIRSEHGIEKGVLTIHNASVFRGLDDPRTLHADPGSIALKV